MTPVVLLGLFAVVAADSAQRDTVPPVPAAVLRLEEVVVRASPLHDMLSSASVHLMDGSEIARLPVSSLSGAVALKAGVVASADGALHVRGGRAGEIEEVLGGIPLVEPIRGLPLEVPLLSLGAVSLISGAPDAEHAGTLAGTLVLSTRTIGVRPEGELRWATDGGLDTQYDRIAGRVSFPLVRGLGLLASGEARLDGTYLPSLRTLGRRQLLGGSFGWRDDNHLIGHLKLAATGSDPRLALDLIGSRRVAYPYDPMWSLDGYTNLCEDFMCSDRTMTPDSTPGSFRYRAADHFVMSDERNLAVVAQAWRKLAGGRVSVALAEILTRRIVSLNGKDDESYAIPVRGPTYGNYESDFSDPFYIYAGDSPFFQRRTSSALRGRTDWSREVRGGSRLGAGFGGAWVTADLRELDLSTVGTGADSMRTFQARAPEGFAYVQGRWVREGLVLNGGLRAQYFTAGAGVTPEAGSSPGGIWTFSPRLGIAYPISVRDVFSLAYSRLHQDPARDFLYENRASISNRQPLGNAALEPSTVITYQAALKHVFDETWAMQAAFFFRDLFGQVGPRVDPTRNAPRYENAEEGAVRGVETSVLARGATGGFELHYTFMIADGTMSDEEGVPWGLRYGTRPAPVGDHPLDWDRRHSIAFTGSWQRGKHLSFSCASLIGSGLPWTPRELRQLDPDFSNINTRRFGWSENTSLAAQWRMRFLRAMTLGVEIRNLFDSRGEQRVSVDGYPQPIINTIYDDYGAYRTETGNTGGAYWDDRNGDGVPGWVPVHDPRLFRQGRSVWMTLSVSLP